MRTYELTFIVRSDIQDEKVNETVEQVKQWITDQGENKVVKVDAWGRRRLAYPIADQREGHYYLFESEIEADTIGEIERNLKLSDAVLRYLLIRQGE